MMRAPDQKEIQAKRLFIGRSLAALLIVVVALTIVLIRLYWLQIQHHDHFKTLATDNRIKLLPLPPSRGEIYDRNGVLLADNRPSYILSIVRERENGTFEGMMVTPISPACLSHNLRADPTS